MRDFYGRKCTPKALRSSSGMRPSSCSQPGGLKASELTCSRGTGIGLPELPWRTVGTEWGWGRSSVPSRIEFPPERLDETRGARETKKQRWGGAVQREGYFRAKTQLKPSISSTNQIWA